MDAGFLARFAREFFCLGQRGDGFMDGGLFGEGEMATPARWAILFRAVFSVLDLEGVRAPRPLLALCHFARGWIVRPNSLGI